MTVKKIVSFKVDRQKLKGVLIFPPEVKPKNPGVLFVHGWSSKGERYLRAAKKLSEKGAICLVFDLRGHGKSEGCIDDLSRKDHLHDVLVAYDFLLSQQSVDENKIGVVGISYAGCLTSLLVSKRKIKWLVFRAPSLHRDDDFTWPSKKISVEENKKYRKNKIKPKNNLSLKSLFQFKGDCLLVESEKDEYITQQTINNYKNAINPRANFTHKIMKGAGHSLKKEEWEKDFIKILENWFERKLNET